MILKDVEPLFHRQSQGFLTIVVEATAQKIRFPVHKVEAAIELEDHIDVSLHEPSDRGESQPFDLFREVFKNCRVSVAYE